MNEKTGVILADPDEMFRAALCSALEENGACVVYESVGDGHAALRAMEERRDAVLVLELTLPGLDGLGVLDALQREGRAGRVIVLSAQTRAQTVQSVMEKGAYYFMVKPCDLASVRTRVREAAARGAMAWMAPAELEWEIVSALYAVGMPPNGEGTTLARNMLLLSVNDRSLLRRPIQKNLFSRVLRGPDDTVGNVERALRCAIESAWRDGDREFQNRLFGATVKRRSGRPTNADFISVMTGYVEMTLRYRAQHGVSGTGLIDRASNG